MSSTQSQPPEGGDRGQQGRDWIKDSLGTDSLAEHLEARVAELEEIAAARWPRRWLLRARLGRQLRDSIRHFPGATFADRRGEAASADWLAAHQATPAPTAATWRPVVTGVSPDGSATIAAADLGTVLGALADAATCHLAHGGDRAAVPAYRRISLALGDDR